VGAVRIRLGQPEAGPAPELWHDDAEYVNAREDPDAATHRGLSAIQTFFAGWFAAYPDLSVQPVESRPNGDRMFVWVRMTGHGATSGLPLDLELAHVWTLEDGKIRRIEEYMDAPRPWPPPASRLPSIPSPWTST